MTIRRVAAPVSLALAALSCSDGDLAPQSKGTVDAAQTGEDARPTGSPAPSDARASSAEAADDGGQDAGAPISCTSTTVDHAASCPGACAIVDDVAVTCNGIFGGVGRVAPAPDATWLATGWKGSGDTLESEPAVFRIAQGQARLEDGVPAPYAVYAPITLALSPDGEPCLAADVTLGPEIPDADAIGAVEFLTHDGSGWASSIITMPIGMDVIDMEVGTDGTPHVWMSGAGPTVHATRDEAGTWSIATAPTVAGGGDTRFTLALDGDPASFDIVFPQAPGDYGDPGQLTVMTGGVETALGSPFSPTSPFTQPFSVTHAISPAAASSAAQLGAAYQGSDGIHVAWLEGQGSTDVSVAGTARPDLQCTGPYDGGCPGPCHETAVGVENNSFALSWTADGTGWLAYVVTHYDKQVHFTVSVPCSSPDGCDPTPGCGEWVDSDNTLYMLHLARVPFDGTPAHDVLSVPVASPNIANAPSRTVDARAFGTNLAIGIGTIDATNRPSIRVMRIDTLQFAADM